MRQRKWMIVRWIASFLSESAALFLLLKAMKAGGLVEGFACAVFGFSALISGVILLGPELALWASEPVHRVFNSLIFPGGSAPPPIDYRLAHLYRKQWRYREAVEEYLKIIEYHPDELAAYLEGIATSRAADAPKTAERFHRLALRHFHDEDSRRQIEEAMGTSTMPPADRLLS